jgi:hypothetical protein
MSGSLCCDIPPRGGVHEVDSKRIDARSEPGEFAGNRVFVKYALGDCPVQFRLRDLKGRGSRLPVAARNRRLDLFDKSTHSTGPRPIDRRPLGRLANAFFR